MSDLGIDPDELYDDATIFLVNIEVFGDGGLKVSGDVHDRAYALSCVDAAKAAVIRHHERPQIFPPSSLGIIKPSDVAYAIQIKVRRNGNMSTGGSINDKALALSILDHARDAISSQHDRIHLGGAGAFVPSHDTEFSYAGPLD